MAAGTPKTALERVARLELENAELRERIARIRHEEALEETGAMGQAPPPPQADRMSKAILFLVIGLLSGLSFAILSTRVSAHVQEAPAPACETPFHAPHGASGARR